MMDKVKKELKLYIDPEKAKYYPKFFKAFEGGYGEGDKFIGVTVPNQRKVAKNFYKEISLKEIESLLKDEIHEYRQTSLFMLTYKYEDSKDFEYKKKIIDLYLRNTNYINNWDLVDSTAYKILGDFLLNRDKDILYKLSKSSNLWEQRISIISTLAFVKAGYYKETIKISERLLNHSHDLIHKAVGWMLREVGKRDYETEYNFLKKHYKKMPRTMLRYSIEKFEGKVRQDFLKGRI